MVFIPAFFTAIGSLFIGFVIFMIGQIIDSRMNGFPGRFTFQDFVAFLIITNLGAACFLAATLTWSLV